MAHQALYRRYRPSKFGEIVGQAHVVAALKNAVASDRVAHAYLFSGPRGTGKTSTARILAKALNCLNVHEGEPCGECQSCAAFADGTSYDMHELDAASHNSVDDIRELNSRVLIGSPGRTKVYVLDEVHMLSSNAENALLKTLEEPPEHVVFLLCTTEPYKVAKTIRSRTQHLLFGLLPEDKLSEHVLSVADSAGIDLSEDGLAYVMAAGGGSARDALSALDQVAAAGTAPEAADSANEVLEALASDEEAAALVAADRALRSGQEPRVLGEALLQCLRDAFLTAVCGPGHVSPAKSSAAEALSQKMKPKMLTHAMETLGEALVGMRTAPDPRIDLELALVRLSRTNKDLDVDALASRIQKLEEALEQMRSGVTESKPATSAPASPSVPSQREPRPAQSASAPSQRTSPPAGGGRPPAGPEQARRELERSASQSQRSSPSVERPRVEPRVEPARTEPRVEPRVERPRTEPRVERRTERPQTERPRNVLPEDRPPSAATNSDSFFQDLPRALPPEDEPPPARSVPEPADDPLSGEPKVPPDSAGSASDAPAASAAPDPAASAGDAPASAAVATAAPAGSAPDPAASAAVATAAPDDSDAPASAPPTREEAVLAWSSDILGAFPKSAVASLSHGRFLPNRGKSLRLGFDHQGPLHRGMAHREDVEAAFSRRFDRKVSVEFVVDDGSLSAPPGSSMPALPSGYEIVSPADIAAPRQPKSNRGFEQMREAFPGAKVIDQSS